MLGQELQSYLNKVYPEFKIENEQTIDARTQIRFELGGGLANGTIERVQQATDRALLLFKDTFSIPHNKIFVLIYEYQGANAFNASNEYLYNHFLKDSSSNTKPKFQTTVSPINNENVRVVIGKFPVDHIAIDIIFKGIANAEMGFDPGIDQSIFFFDPLTDRGFHMYDDRGCYVFSDSKKKIEEISIKHKDLVIDFN